MTTQRVNWLAPEDPEYVMTNKSGSPRSNISDKLSQQRPLMRLSVQRGLGVILV